MYSLAKFHAKTYLFETNQLSDYAIVGSSNFTKPGLTQNVELNVLTTDQLHLEKLKAWYTEMWKLAGERYQPGCYQSA